MPAASPAAEATSGTAAADAVPVPCSSGTASGLPVHWWPGVPGWNPGWTGMMYDPNGGGVAAPAGPVGGGPPTFSSYGFKWWSSGHGGPVLVTSQLGRDLRRRFLGRRAGREAEEQRSGIGSGFGLKSSAVTGTDTCLKYLSTRGEARDVLDQVALSDLLQRTATCCYGSCWTDVGSVGVMCSSSGWRGNSTATGKFPDNRSPPSWPICAVFVPSTSEWIAAPTSRTSPRLLNRA